jgi:hypothetical protein
LPALEKWLNIIDGEVEDEAFKAKFLESRLWEWERHRKEALYLICKFEEQMSPRCLLSLPLLRFLDDDTKAWLGLLVHGLWLHRYRVSALMDSAMARVRDVDGSFEILKKSIRVLSEPPSPENMRPLGSQFLAFFKACSELAREISRFPNEIRFT